MDMSNIMQIGAQLFQNQLDKDGDGQIGIGDIASAMTGLMSGHGGQVNLGNVVSQMQGQGGGLSSILASWLGDGPNQDIHPSQVESIFGADKISAFAQQLGITPDKALGGLAQALPAVVDKSSTGGSLLDMVGGVSGAIGLAGKLFGH